MINFFRSIPFIILLTWVIPLSRAIMGTAIDVPGAIVPLVLGTVPFFSARWKARWRETDKGLVEAALSMGSSPMEIIFRVYLHEGVAAIARATTITAHLPGRPDRHGGRGRLRRLGDFAIRYGHDRGMTDVTWITVIVVFILVSILQLFGNLVIKKTGTKAFRFTIRSMIFMNIQKRKIVIIGAGHVGSHAGYALISQGLAEEIVYIDVDEEDRRAGARSI